MCSNNPDFSRRIPLTEAWSELRTLNQKQAARFHHRQLGENTYLNYSKRLSALRNPNFTYSSATVITLTCTLLISDLPTLSFPPLRPQCENSAQGFTKKVLIRRDERAPFFIFFLSLSLSLANSHDEEVWEGRALVVQNFKEELQRQKFSWARWQRRIIQIYSPGSQKQRDVSSLTGVHRRRNAQPVGLIAYRAKYQKMLHIFAVTAAFKARPRSDCIRTRAETSFHVVCNQGKKKTPSLIQAPHKWGLSIFSYFKNESSNLLNCYMEKKAWFES